MKNRAALLAFMAMAAMMPHQDRGQVVDITPLTEDEKKQRKAKIEQSHGLKPFYVDGTLIYAINYKNALRKYKKLTP